MKEDKNNECPASLVEELELEEVYKLSLEDSIKLYSWLIVNNNMDINRCLIHNHMCEILNVDKMFFKPFDMKSDPNINTEKEAERILRSAIKKIKDRRK